MAAGQTQYLYTVELNALEEELGHSIDQVARLREKAMKRQDLEAAAQANQLERGISLVRHRIARLK